MTVEPETPETDPAGTSVVVNIDAQPEPEPEPAGEPAGTVVLVDAGSDSGAGDAGDALEFAEQVRAIAREEAYRVVAEMAPTMGQVVDTAAAVAAEVAAEVVAEDDEGAAPAEDAPAPPPAQDPDPEPKSAVHWWFRPRKASA